MTTGATPNRPLSPHLQVWRFTPTMAASITHRGTGIILYGGSILLALWLVCLAVFPEAFQNIAHPIAASWFGTIVVCGYVWALCFHLMNGLRHLYWDTGRGLAPKTATMTALMIYGGSVLLAAIVLIAGFSARGGA